MDTHCDALGSYSWPVSTTGFGTQTAVDTDVRHEERTVPTDEGDHERFSHYVDKDKLTEAMVMGTPVVALCGKVWVPSRAPEKFPVCPECKEVWESLNEDAGDSRARVPPSDPRRRRRSTPAGASLRPGRSARPGAPRPRCAAWQTAAMRQYFDALPRDFLAVATPGAGKTTFALSVAAELLGRRLVDRITIVAPTEHLKLQWAEAAGRAGIPIDPAYAAGKGKTSQDYLGIAVTYAGVAVNPLALRIRTERFKTLVILDEVHHAGDALSWGEGVREAFEPAHRRLALTGTPFRSDVNPIPFVTYAPGADGVPRSVADYTYGYAEALGDRVVRPVLFMAYSGELQWRTRAGDEIAARLGEPLTKDLTAQALRTALDPEGAWIPSVLSAADMRLTEVRRHVPDAGGLVIATDQDSARSYAKTLQGRLRRGAHRGAVRREAGVEEDRGLLRAATSAGWSRSGWSPRASTYLASRSGSTPRPPRRRCSSPRRSAASSAPGAVASPPRSSCRRCRTC